MLFFFLKHRVKATCISRLQNKVILHVIILLIYINFNFYLGYFFFLYFVCEVGSSFVLNEGPFFLTKMDIKL